MTRIKVALKRKRLIKNVLLPHPQFSDTLKDYLPSSPNFHIPKWAGLFPIHTEDLWEHLGRKWMWYLNFLKPEQKKGIK